MSKIKSKKPARLEIDEVTTCDSLSMETSATVERIFPFFIATNKTATRPWYVSPRDR
jgi:hypothetical protein